MANFPTFILDLANPGSLEKAEEIVKVHSKVMKGQNAAFKFQFRDLVNYAHGDKEYAKKFEKTSLHPSLVDKLTRTIKDEGFKVGATPFDPGSVEWIAIHEIDFVKIASCSARDWNTIKEAASLNLPTIFSTGGCTIEDIDNLVSFAEHKGLEFALMHCVSLYPTPPTSAFLNRISWLKKRYPGVKIGWSTHEKPQQTSLGYAYALGAELFEWHIGLDGCNDYSADPSGTETKIATYKRATDLMLWREEWKDRSVPLLEQERALERVARRNIPNNPDPPHRLKKHIHQIKGMLNEAGIKLPPDFSVTFSHHDGLCNFATTGATFIEIVNRDYCKKLMVLLPEQTHPYHYHKLKDETFQVLWGTFALGIDQNWKAYEPGEVVSVQPGTWHSFQAYENGAIVEEISTRAIEGDSVYKEALPWKRKTTVKGWGRFEL